MVQLIAQAVTRRDAAAEREVYRTPHGKRRPMNAVSPAQARGAFQQAKVLVIQQQERQAFATTTHRRHWIPACAGMTVRSMNREARIERYGCVGASEAQQPAIATPQPQ
jgi:hypothetical protein